MSASQSVRVVVENNPSYVSPSCYQEAFFMFTRGYNTSPGILRILNFRIKWNTYPKKDFRLKHALHGMRLGAMTNILVAVVYMY